MREAVIVSTARTGIGRAYRGAFNATPSPTLAAHPIRAAIERAGEYALRAEQRTAEAQRSGKFDDEIIAVTAKMAVKDKETGEVSMREVTLDRDEGNRPDTTLDGLAKLEPVRGPGKIITAGN